MQTITHKCPDCKGKFKLIKTSHSIKTRDERRRIINIDKIPTLECIICGHREFSTKGEELIQDVKHMVKLGLEELAKKEELELHSKQEHTITNVLKRFIG